MLITETRIISLERFFRRLVKKNKKTIDSDSDTMFLSPFNLQYIISRQELWSKF